MYFIYFHPNNFKKKPKRKQLYFLATVAVAKHRLYNYSKAR